MNDVFGEFRDIGKYKSFDWCWKQKRKKRLM